MTNSMLLLKNSNTRKQTPLYSQNIMEFVRVGHKVKKTNVSLS